MASGLNGGVKAQNPPRSRPQTAGGSEPAAVGPVYPAPVAEGDTVALSQKAKPANTCGCGELAAADAVGPLLRFTGYDPDSDTWNGTVLFVCKPSVTVAPVLHWRDAAGQSGLVEGVCLDSFCEWNFWRSELEVPVGDEEKRVDYTVEGVGAHFFIAGRDQPYHWGYYSCNGFTPDVPRGEVEAKWAGLDPLWNDVLARHRSLPLHCMVGGGDQLYNDDVLKCPALGPFVGATPEQRAAMEFYDEMKFDVEEYYFHHYAVHFTYGAIGEAFRTIPQIMTWDDHDIFDGWGSYPERIQNSQVFQGIFRAARRFYLLFQLHTTAELARWHNVFGRKSFNQVVLLGTRVALALPDCRSQRTENQVLALDTHMNLIIKVDELPETVTHLVVGTTVPVVYPHLLGGDAVLSFLAKLNKIGIVHRLFKSTGFDKMVFNEVEEPELLDDLRDHWSSPTHRDERRFLIEHLQMLAKIKNLRVSLISGDVHLATTGRLYTYPKPDNFKRDFRFMPQIVSSAIVNAPPPDGLVSALHLLGRAGFTNRHTRNKMCKLFDAEGKHRLLNRRNWCEIWELDAEGDGAPGALRLLPGQPAEPGGLVFNLRVETFDASKGETARDARMLDYQTVAPVLERPRASAAARRKGIVHQQDVYGGHAWSKRYDPRLSDGSGRVSHPGVPLGPAPAEGDEGGDPESDRLKAARSYTFRGRGGRATVVAGLATEEELAAAAKKAAREEAGQEPPSPSAVDDPEEHRFFK